MTRRRLGKHLIRKITKIGGTSYSITLPIQTIRDWKWRERQRVVLEINNEKKTILIKDFKPKRKK